MATTAKGTPYVESSDLVADYPTVSLALAEHIDDFGGKVLQVVRATDTTARSTTSTSFVDVTGMSVTITPQKSTSVLILITTGYGFVSGGSVNILYVQITDSSNNPISGSEGTQFGNGSTALVRDGVCVIGYATPATISPVTYKTRFRTETGSTAFFANANSTGQIFAIEVSA